jgi:endoglucanase
VWQLRGETGVMDSMRKDVDYIDWRGHKLDLEMLELLQRY